MKSEFATALFFTLFILMACGHQKTQENIYTETKSGLKYLILQEGKGPKAKKGDEVIVKERMGYTNGKELFSTEGMKNLPKILLGGGQAIAGVDEGLRGMRVGEVRKLIVPPSLSKRTQYPTFLSPDSTLVYNIELVEIIKP